MSLLSEAMEPCVILNKTIKDDGYGGYYTSWQEGVEIQAAFTFDTSIEARSAEKEGVTSLYTVTTGREIVLNYHDVIKRQRDGKILRITSDGDDKFTPKSANLNMRQVTAEEWNLSNE